MLKIYYTGLGAKKSGYHTETEFLYIMNKIFRRACIDYHNAKKNNETNECIECTLQEYIEFSGAEIQ
jgi:hypothetical protein